MYCIVTCGPTQPILMLQSIISFCGLSTVQDFLSPYVSNQASNQYEDIKTRKLTHLHSY